MTLNDLKPYETGIITEILLNGPIKQRLTDMGVIKGASVTMLRIAPLGDPIEYFISGYNLCLRKKEASQIIINKADNNYDKIHICTYRKS